ncbi:MULTISPECIES: phosphopentomutase [unclassified Sinorhizobium]|uniref:phosphopentomutase n=1 Tax=unclassified Sinorhizobium TaxID=2613772 RepID=UPI0024C22D60|nr:MULTISPECIES: phosphopentomutase [unclassified Sinorhizobium]MDK1377429.1 phosphopentomutase [Sinorhizobium sp. 6-70]MDK1477670.1 phosphopentomutase [Sinorhizobium sp. 6-117]
MARAFLFVLDSFGIGGAPDAEAFGDLGADTLGHIAEFCAAGAGDRAGLREGPLQLPNMSALGLMHAAKLATGRLPAGMSLPERVYGVYGAASETSRGKDTPSGHWEIAGTPVMFDWGYFPAEGDAFPAELVEAICREGDVPGILGNCHASGTEIIARFGEEHRRSGKPICYTSSDSVFQIAAHEQSFGLDRLLELCQVVRRLVDDYNIGRVIARPFVGDNANNFTRTGNRRDYSVLPPEPTVLDRLKEAGRKVHAVGKIGDIFAHQGVTKLTKANGNMALFDASLAAIEEAEDGDLVFTNFVDFDMLYGHRRDVPGYAAALEAFDARLPDLDRRLKPGDIVILTADHGCDPTWRGTDHTRERVPVLMFGPSLRSRSFGVANTFAHIGETVARHLGIAPGPHGRSLI